jgi:glycerophosphoryl diester phosphodiesterase
MKPSWLAAFVAFTAPAAALDLQGHRGARGLMPENTLPAFERALAIGVSTLEFDLGMTKDEVLVVHHDAKPHPEIARAPDGAYVPADAAPLRAWMLAELQTLDVGRLKPGGRYGAGFPAQVGVDGARIPRLSDVFALGKPRGVHFNIETKITPTSGETVADPETFATALVAAVKEAGVAERVTIQSFDWRTLQVARRLAPEIRRVCLTTESNLQRGRPGPSPWTAGLDLDAFGGSVPRLVQAAGCAVWSPAFRELAPESLAEAKALKIGVIPWTVNERADLERLIDMGVDGLITDYPDRLKALMDERGLKPKAYQAGS